MIYIEKIARDLERFLGENFEQGDYRIFIHTNFSIDVHVFTSSEWASEDKLKEAFGKFLKNEDGREESTRNFKVKFNVHSEEDKDDPFFANILLSPTIDEGLRYRLNSLLEEPSKMHGEEKDKVPIVTFYSYKGGVGRTTTMVAYAIDLAVNQHKTVVIVDCDLEAPGYLNFFALSKHAQLESGEINGLVEFISDSQFLKDSEEIEINNYMINVGNSSNMESYAWWNYDNIWLIPAGNLNEKEADCYERGRHREHYLEGLSRINLSNTNMMRKSFKLLFDKVKEAVNPDIILIDSRTGFNDVFGTSALCLSDYVVGFFGDSRQTTPGLRNLLEKYYAESSDFKLDLVRSIVPAEENPECTEEKLSEKNAIINDYVNEEKDRPGLLMLHRNKHLEELGNGDSKIDQYFEKEVVEGTNTDYCILFKRISSKVFPAGEGDGGDENSKMETNYNTDAIEQTKDKKDDISSMSDIRLRNRVLKRLLVQFEATKQFAEDTEIKEDTFFYRDCMKGLFEKNKFLISGAKGTGKTYLYRALTEEKISNNIQQWRGESSDNGKNVFINILPFKETIFKHIDFSKKYANNYFYYLWKVYTWYTILRNGTAVSKIEESEFFGKFSSDGQSVIMGMGEDGFKTSSRLLDYFNDIISEGLKKITAIEDDLIVLDKWFRKKNSRLFVLYDRLDTIIEPQYWGMAVSPLIDWWRDDNDYESINPKIFVRTDLFGEIKGTNTIRLRENTLNIEWSIGEIFGYFFKLVFSDKEISDVFWEFFKRKSSKDKSYMENTKAAFKRMPANQFKFFNGPEMAPIVEVFFGKYVVVNMNEEKRDLGKPWEFFQRELSNANGTCSLRPFVNLLKGGVIRQVLNTTIGNPSTILIPSIYAGKEARDRMANDYFEDLTRDTFSEDLKDFRGYIRGENGKKFRFKSLNESQYADLLECVYEQAAREKKDLNKDNYIKNMKNLLFANGIMAKKTISGGGVWYRFAPMYMYAWGLKNSELESKGKKYGLKKGEVLTGRVAINEEKGKFYIIVNGRKKDNGATLTGNIDGESVAGFVVGDEVRFVVRTATRGVRGEEKYRFRILEILSHKQDV